MTKPSLWPTCEHGYYITPSHKCPWCFNGDPAGFTHVVGQGNGWLLKKDDLTCKRCGGPRGAGWGAWASDKPPTPENVRAEMEKVDFCYSCTPQLHLDTSQLHLDKAALAIYVVAGYDVMDAIDMINECGDSRILDTLLEMLTTTGNANTDVELNNLLIRPTRRQLFKMTGEGLSEEK